MEKELEILGLATGLSEGDIFRHAVSIFRLHIEAASKGRKIRILAGNGSQEEEFRLPFQLKGKYLASFGRKKVE